MNRNPMCGGSHCHVSNGEVRVLPTGGNSNAILCRWCYEHEMTYRRNRNKRLGADQQYPIPSWDTLAVYNGAE